MLGLLPEPEDGRGHFLEDVEAALLQAEALGLVMPRDKFIQVGRAATADDLGSLM